MKLDQLSYVLVGTIIAAALATAYPIFSGDWRFAPIGIPLFAVIGFFSARHVLKKHDLPFGATFGDMRNAVANRQRSTN